MASKKWTEKSAVTTVDGKDLSLLVANADTSSYKITIANLLSGWVADTNTWAYSSADAPTFIASVNADMTDIIGVGMRIKLTQSSAEKFFIVTAVGAFSAGATLITFYGGTSFTLTAAAVSLVSWSAVKAPIGFPLNPTLWTVEKRNVAGWTQLAPTQDVWYNVESIVVPVGMWNLYYEAPMYSNGPAVGCPALTTLSNANNTELDKDMTCFSGAVVQGVSGVATWNHVTRQKIFLLSAKTTYYLNFSVPASGMTSIAATSTFSPIIIRAVCAYL
jgi:hypothetical protein